MLQLAVVMVFASIGIKLNNALFTWSVVLMGMHGIRLIIWSPHKFEVGMNAPNLIISALLALCVTCILVLWVPVIMLIQRMKDLRKMERDIGMLFSIVSACMDEDESGVHCEK